MKTEIARRPGRDTFLYWLAISFGKRKFDEGFSFESPNFGRVKNMEGTFQYCDRALLIAHSDALFNRVGVY